MEKVIATIVIIVLTMGLISYAIIGQMGGFRDTADTVTNESSRLDAMLNDSSIVPISTVRSYVARGTANGFDVNVYDSQAGGGGTPSEITDVSVCGENAVFNMEKIYDDYGKIETINFYLISQAAVVA
ncbi:MAG: hypothetical protein IIW02_05370 [Clostridia bacterium]|nr:hypothetical protein [Clostridia bacterium]